jgi:hypothetical protein
MLRRSMEHQAAVNHGAASSRVPVHGRSVPERVLAVQRGAGNRATRQLLRSRLAELLNEGDLHKGLAEWNLPTFEHLVIRNRRDVASRQREGRFGGEEDSRASHVSISTATKRREPIRVVLSRRWLD